MSYYTKTEYLVNEGSGTKGIITKEGVQIIIGFKVLTERFDVIWYTCSKGTTEQSYLFL